jgi:hypothetical protein
MTRDAQIAGGFPDAVARTCQLIDENVSVDFVDLNMGCPIDLVRQQGSESHSTPEHAMTLALSRHSFVVFSPWQAALTVQAREHRLCAWLFLCDLRLRDPWQMNVDLSPTHVHTYNRVCAMPLTQGWT